MWNKGYFSTNTSFKCCLSSTHCLHPALRTPQHGIAERVDTFALFWDRVYTLICHVLFRAVDAKSKGVDFFGRLHNWRCQLGLSRFDNILAEIYFYLVILDLSCFWTCQVRCSVNWLCNNRSLLDPMFCDVIPAQVAVPHWPTDGYHGGLDCKLHFAVADNHILLPIYFKSFFASLRFGFMVPHLQVAALTCFIHRYSFVFISTLAKRFARLCPYLSASVPCVVRIFSHWYTSFFQKFCY